LKLQSLVRIVYRLGNLGIVLVGMQRFEEATTAFQGAVAIFRETGDRHREGTALNNLELLRVAQQT
jgi:hypothetical protein